MTDIGLFTHLTIETATLCNRTCPTCLRQTDPTRSWWNEDGTQKDVKLPAEVVYSIVDQATKMGYHGLVYFYLWNEPLLEPRYFDFARYAQKKGLKVGLFTNAELLTPENPNTMKVAEQIDECIDIFAIDEYYRYMNHLPIENCNVRRRYLVSLFKKVKITWAGPHLIVHFSPSKQLQQLTELNKNNPCYLTCRMVINHEGKMQLCCVDIMCKWDLGNVSDTPLQELWYNQKHQEIVKTLARPGGRLSYPYCSLCPLKGGTKVNQGQFLKELEL